MVQILRNLKPSSLYVKSINDITRLEIGDFGPITILKDILNNTRVKSGAFNYQAPEIIDSQDYDKKSDIWSIGAILLDICTTSIFDVITSINFKLNIWSLIYDYQF